MCRRLAARYHGRDSMAPVARDTRVSWTTDWLDEPVSLIQNQYNQYTETFVSKVGSRDAPKTALVCTEADWALKQRVITCSRLLEAEMQMRQGVFANIHKLGEQALRLAYACVGTVAAKVYAWPNEDRVVVELHDTLDMFLDDTEMTYGPPVTYGEVTWWNPYVLKQRFPTVKPEDIQTEQPIDRGGLGFVGRTQQTELVPVFEAWKVSRGKNDPGRHIAGLRSGRVLVDEDWECDEPPFAFLHLMPQLFGFWAIPPMDLVDEEICRSNEILSHCDEAEFDTPKAIHYVDEAHIVNIDELTETQTLKIIRTKGQYQPLVANPPPFDRISLELKAHHDQSIAKILGIDEMHVAARREPGLTSGVAQREASQRFDDRFAQQHRAYNQFIAVDIARHMLRAQKQLAESGEMGKRRWEGELLSSEINPEDIIDLDLDRLMVQAKPISELKNSPEERVQYAQELADRGAIPIEALMSIMQTYDTPGETKVVKTQRRLIAKQIDRWLMADDDEIDGDFYQGPRPWMRPADAIIQVTDALMQAEIDEVPQERLDFFLNYIAELAPLLKAATPAPDSMMLGGPLQAPPGMMGAPGPGAMPAPGAEMMTPPQVGAQPLV